jgi:hypothetical protein
VTYLGNSPSSAARMLSRCPGGLDENTREAVGKRELCSRGREFERPRQWCGRHGLYCAVFGSDVKLHHRPGWHLRGFHLQGNGRSRIHSDIRGDETSAGVGGHILTCDTSDPHGWDRRGEKYHKRRAKRGGRTDFSGQPKLKSLQANTARRSIRTTCNVKVASPTDDRSHQPDGAATAPTSVIPSIASSSRNRTAVTGAEANGC